MRLISIIVAVLVVFSLFADISTAQPGFYTAINADGVNRITAKVLPGFINQIKGASFPDVRDGHHRVLNTRVESIGLNSFNMDVSDQGVLSLIISRFNVAVAFKYRYKRKFISVSTGIRASLSDANFRIQLKLTNQGGKFAIAVHDVHVSAGDASIKFTGKSIKSKFLNAVKSIFKSKIKNTILSKIRDTLRSSLSTFANSFVSGVIMRANVSDWGSIDFSLVGPIRYAQKNIIVGFSGDIQAQNDHVPTPIKRNNIVFNPTNRLFSIGIDTFVFNSGFHNFFRQGRFNHVSTKESPNGFKGATLTTNEWGKTLPAIAKKHPNLNIRLVLRFAQAPVISSTGGQLRFNGLFKIFIQVGANSTWTNAVVLQTKLEAGATVTIRNNAVVAQIQDIKPTLSVAESSIGNIDLAVAVIQQVFRFSIDVAVPMINTRLLAGIPLPMNGKMVVSNPSIVFPQNAIVAATDIDFKV